MTLVGSSILTSPPEVPVLIDSVAYSPFVAVTLVISAEINIFPVIVPGKPVPIPAAYSPPIAVTVPL